MDSRTAILIGQQETHVKAAENMPAETMQQEHSPLTATLIALSSFFFVLLQSACTAFIAISGLRLLIGLGSLAAASSGLKFLASIHADRIRIPMLLLAVAGSFINLYAIQRTRSLRARPSSAWRMLPLTPEKRRSESIQIVLAIATLLLVAAEEALHLYLHGL